MKNVGFILFFVMTVVACGKKQGFDHKVFETSAAGNKLKEKTEFAKSKKPIEIKIDPSETFQSITGFGGSFTESSAYLLNQMSKGNRKKILQAYFGPAGSRYSLARTHINSCDFSLGHYSYAPVEGDMELEHFSIEEDMDDIVPMIKEAMGISEDGFKLISSPWTAPPWMKDNNAWTAGKLLPEYYGAWALFFNKYLDAYKEQGIDVWGITVENEPLGNGGNWESMHFTPGEMTRFVADFLGPRLESGGFGHVKILGYDQNREELPEWVDSMYESEKGSKYFSGTAIHWYRSTFEFFPKELQYAHNKAPSKHLINTEACVDSEVPHWKNDGWYWAKEATDWGYDWASPEHKHLHPKYVPVYRYARNIIGSLNNWVDGWVDWNMVLDRQGGPNWFKNWCVAPVIVDPGQDEVYFTPIYYTLAHFSKYIRPNAKITGSSVSGGSLQVVSAVNPDGGIAVVILNEEVSGKSYRLNIKGRAVDLSIDGRAIQTIVVPTFP